MQLSMGLRSAAIAAIAALAVLATGQVAAEAAAQADSLRAAGTAATVTVTVFTRARVASFHEEAGNRFFVRLKLLPRAKLPFTTQIFSVRDRSLLDGISEGAWVKFTSRHVDGENVLTAIHVVAECRRFQACE